MISRLFFLLILLGAVTSCTKRVTQEDLIREAVQLKMDEWKLAQLSTCKDRAMIKANAFVDSILLAKSLESRLDTIQKPGKPVRPPKPVFKQKPDSLKVDELIPILPLPPKGGQ